MSGPTPAGVTTNALHKMAARFGVEPTDDEWRAAVLAIIDGRALLLRVMPARPISRAKSTEVYALVIGGVAVEVVWAPATGAIITILPRNSRSAHTRDFTRRKTMSCKDEARRVFANFGDGDES